MAASALLVACTGNTSEQGLLQSAKQLIEKRQFSGATIQLKNLLQKNAASAEARFLLGAMLLETGDITGAETELHKARELGHPDALVVPMQAKVMLAQGQFKKLIADYGNFFITEPEAAADLATSLAVAYTQTGSKDQAKTLIDSVLRMKPDFLPAIILEARAMAAAEGADAALLRLSAVPAAIKSAEASHLEGLLRLNGKHDIPGALQAFDRALSIDPTYIPAHSSLIALYLHRQDMASAKRQIASLKKALPKSLVSKLYDAQIAYLDGDFKTARAMSQVVLGSMPNNLRALYIAGAAELGLGSSLQAASHLNKALSLSPDLHEARLLLAKTYLRSAQPAQALKVLAPMLDSSKPDADSLTLAAEAHQQAGDLTSSELYYQRALKVRPDDAFARTALAMANLDKGRDELGFRELENIAKSDRGPTADMALISSYMKRGQIEAALSAIEALERKQPGSVYPLYLRGKALMLRPDVAGARNNFERAIEKDPTYFPAVSSLAVLDLLESRIDSAQARLEKLTKAAPGNTQAAMALADLRATHGGSTEEVVRLIDNAIKTNPDDAAPRLMLLEYLLLVQNYKAALEVARDAIAAVPSSAELLDASGRAQLAVGETLQAITTFSRLSKLYPTFPLAHVRLAEAYLLLKDNESALRSLKQALAISPNMLQAQQLLIAIEVQARRFDRALQMARMVQKQRPDQAVGYQLEGSIHAEQLQWDAAIQSYRIGLDKVGPGALPAKLHFALLGAKKTTEAEQFVASWLKSNGKDIGFVLYLADVALMQHKWAVAEQHYRRAMELAPKNATAVNNIAWLLVKQKKPGAVTMAKRAVSLAPNSAAAQDTLALALAEEKQFSEAVGAALKAVALEPEAGRYRLTLAKLHILAGDKDKARTELKELTTLGDKFSSQADVAQLLKDL